MVTLNNVYSLVYNNELYSDTPVYTHKGKFRKLKNRVRIKLSNNDIIIIEKGFEWDENSIPWILQPFYPKSRKYAGSALVHDALYYLTVHDKDWVEEEYKKWMIATKINNNQIFFRYWAVKLFGGRWWYRNKKTPGERCLHNRTKLTLIKPL